MRLPSNTSPVPVAIKVALVVFFAALLVSCAAEHSWEIFTDQFQSPDIGCHQGYATDGKVHFLFDTSRILKRADDPAWSILLQNEGLFQGLSGYDHMGDGDYFDGLLFAPVEHYRRCSDTSNPAIFVFDAANLERLKVVPLTTGQEVSGVAVVPASREIWVSSFCDGTRLWVYDLESFVFKRTVTLSSGLKAIQGLAYRDDHFYVAQDNGTLYRVAVNGKTEQVFKTDTPGAHEGLDYSQREIRWLIDEGPGEQKIHFITRTVKLP